MKILVSSCLLGVECRYCGTGYPQNKVIELQKKHILIPICPEQLGGLPTPRQSVELVKNEAGDKFGVNYTESFRKGANETLKIAQLLGIKYAILKVNSPSCGFGRIYDGTFSGKLNEGNGVTANLLSQNGIRIFNEKTIEERYFID